MGKFQVEAVEKIVVPFNSVEGVLTMNLVTLTRIDVEEEQKTPKPGTALIVELRCLTCGIPAIMEGDVMEVNIDPQRIEAKLI